MTLPYDISRCTGLRDVAMCDTCRRREPGHPTHQWYTPPAWDDGRCPNYIPVRESEE